MKYITKIDGRTKHGKSSTRAYNTWRMMIQRCTKESCPSWGRYGGAGIGVCERWLDFRNFYADMGDHPDGLTIDRIDGKKGYSPDNCRWATYSQQNRNKRNTVNIEIDGTTKCIKDWCEELGANYTRVRRRLWLGWEPKKALLAPVRRYRRP